MADRPYILLAGKTALDLETKVTQKIEAGYLPLGGPLVFPPGSLIGHDYRLGQAVYLPPFAGPEWEKIQRSGIDELLT